MPANDMAKLMRDHALDFICGRCGVDQAAVEVHRLAAGNKGVDGLVVDQDDVDIFGVKPRCRNQRRGNLIEKSLGLCIAQNRLRHGGAHRYENCKKQDECCPDSTKRKNTHVR